MGKPRGNRGITLRVLGILPQRVVDKTNGVLERVSRPIHTHRTWVLPLVTAIYALSYVGQMLTGGIRSGITVPMGVVYVWTIVFTIGGPGMFGDPDAGLGSATARA